MDAIGYLPTFLAVCDAGGFQRASEALHLSQPAVSYQMRTLEAALGVALFDRIGRGVALTEAGMRLREFARTSLHDFSQLRRALLEGVPIDRPLRIASVSVFGRYVLFPILSKDANVELRFPTQDEVLMQVAGGAVDVGFIYEPRVRSALTATGVWTEELVLVAPRTGPNAIRTMSFAKLIAMPFVTWDEYEYVFGRWFASAFDKQPGPLRSVAHFEELEEVLGWVAAGKGVSIAPRDCVQGAVAKHIAIRGARRRCTNEIHAVWRADRPRNEVADLVRRLRERR